MGASLGLRGKRAVNFFRGFITDKSLHTDVPILVVPPDAFLLDSLVCLMPSALSLLKWKGRVETPYPLLYVLVIVGIPVVIKRCDIVFVYPLLSSLLSCGAGASLGQGGKKTVNFFQLFALDCSTPGVKMTKPPDLFSNIGFPCFLCLSTSLTVHLKCLNWHLLLYTGSFLEAGGSAVP